MLKKRIKRFIVSTSRLFHPLLKSLFYKQPDFVISDNDHHTFFGYYDVCPFNQNETILLACKAPLIFKTPSKRDSLKIGFYDLNNFESGFRKIVSTETWCWQQGARLQWYGGEPNTIFYNSLDEDSYRGTIQNYQNQEILLKTTLPLYAIHPNGQWGLSLNFSRLQRLRPGYGYNCLPDESQGKLCPADDGIFLVDIQNNKSQLLFSLEDLAKTDPEESMIGAEHYVNHAMMNPSGNRFLFFHIWSKHNKRKIRLYTCNLDGSDLYLLNNSGHTSHCCWISDTEILAYATATNIGMGYLYFRDQTSYIEKICWDLLKRDGHPTHIDQDFFLTDTYPDKLRNQQLILVNKKLESKKIIGSFFSPFQFDKEIRCDLHPRISPTKKWVCIDSVVNNKRVMVVLKINQDKSIYSL